MCLNFIKHGNLNQTQKTRYLSERILDKSTFTHSERLKLRVKKMLKFIWSLVSHMIPILIFISLQIKIRIK